MEKYIKVSVTFSSFITFVNNQSASMKNKIFSIFIYSLLILSIASVAFLSIEVDVLEIAFNANFDSPFQDSSTFAEKDTFTKLVLDAIIHIFRF